MISTGTLVTNDFSCGGIYYRNVKNLLIAYVYSITKVFITTKKNSTGTDFRKPEMPLLLTWRVLLPWGNV
jgi:hypothetical protein